MACIFGHKWNGCKCEKCGATREHDYIKDGENEWDICKNCDHITFRNVPFAGCAIVMEKITDNKVLEQLSQGEEDTYVRYFAAIRLDDKRTAMEIVSKEFRGVEFDQARREIFSLITDKNLLIETAKSHKHWLFRREAIYHIDNQDLLVELGYSESDDAVLDAIKQSLNAETQVRIIETQNNGEYNKFQENVIQGFLWKAESEPEAVLDVIEKISTRWILERLVELDNEISQKAQKILDKLKESGNQ